MFASRTFFGAGGGIVNPLPTLAASGSFSLPGSGSASCTIQSNGYINCAGSDGEQDGNWFFPNETGIGAAYWVRVTAAGDTPSGTLNTWLALSGNRVFSLSSSNGSKSCALTIQIATDSSGTNVVTSGSCDLTVTEIF